MKGVMRRLLSDLLNFFIIFTYNLPFSGKNVKGVYKKVQKKCVICFDNRNVV